MMRTLQRVAKLLAVLLACTAAPLAPLPAAAQGVSPTPEELQIFQGLSPEQQQAIMGQLGGGALGSSDQGSSLSRMGERQSTDQFGRSRQNGPGQNNRDQRRNEGDEEEEGEGKEPLIPQLKSEDWVIIEIDYQLPPRPVPPYLQSLYAAQAAQTGNTAAITAAIQSQQQQSQSSANSGSTSNSPNGQGNNQSNSNPGQPLINANGTAPTPFEVQLTDDERERLEALMTLIRSKNPYRLARDGSLTLPGFAPIALLGLTEEQATLRLKVEPAFRGIDVRLTRLPLKKSGAEGLKPFGYDLFDHELSTFAPATNVPVPAEYIVGPGDELDVQLYGSQNKHLKITVQRDGTVSLPELGPISVGGQNFEQVKSGIESRVQQQLIGVRASVSMGDTRSIKVFVLGEARYPGTYTVSGLSTITSALYAAGGAKRAGSLRTVQLKRHGTLVRQFDLYDLLIRGDTTDDAKLLQGDVIFIPPVGPTAGIDGEVRRPAIYELKSESTVADLLQLAGGLTPDADHSNAMLTRIDENQRRVVVPVHLGTGAGGESLRNGDLVHVMRLRPTLDSGILVQGHVYAPGTFAYHPGIRLADVVRSVDELRPDADIHYLIIRRELPPDRRISVISADLAAALADPGSSANVELMPRDRITVFDLASGRDHVIQPLLNELRVQGTAGHPTETVHVDGQVKVPGEYPLEPGMRVSDLVRAGGGAADAAYGNTAELTRFSIAADETRHAEHIEIDLAAALRGDAAANIQLRPFDTLSVKETPLWAEQESIVLKGEVRFPGNYTIRRGETLKSVIGRAGGLTAYAFPEGSVFTREWLKKREQEQLDNLAARMQTDLAALAVASAASGQGGGAATLTVGQSLLGQIRGARAVGRMVIDLPRLMREPTGSTDDVILRGGDVLIVPRFQQQVTVLGEVQNSTSHLYNPRLSRDDYIALSGGTTRRADRSRIYVVRANGSVVASEGNRWFQHSSGVTIKPGDTVVVPLDTERMPPLPFWQAVTGILYNVAIAVAAVHSF
jgi:polysaccharide biosynthesis/export protein